MQLTLFGGIWPSRRCRLVRESLAGATRASMT